MSAKKKITTPDQAAALAAAPAETMEEVTETAPAEVAAELQELATPRVEELPDFAGIELGECTLMTTMPQGETRIARATRILCALIQSPRFSAKIMDERQQDCVIDAAFALEAKLCNKAVALDADAAEAIVIK
ncbi:MAG: hypothetical protein R3Y56_02265 [Akkermansia sp.]